MSLSYEYHDLIYALFSYSLRIAPLRFGPNTWLGIILVNNHRRLELDEVVLTTLNGSLCIHYI